ncbi:MAG: hypothetical protein J6R01_02960 [Alistipes sp.]|nr:hypothetical protein [Alistipes sp.]
MNFFHDISKFCIVALIAVVAVSCSSEITCPEPDRPQPKPVQPIKPRPIVPDGQIQRPRAIDGLNTDIRIDFFKFAGAPVSVQIYAISGELLFDDVVRFGEVVELSADLSTLLFVVDGEDVNIQTIEQCLL